MQLTVYSVTTDLETGFGVFSGLLISIFRVWNGMKNRKERYTYISLKYILGSWIAESKAVIIFNCLITIARLESWNSNWFYLQHVSTQWLINCYMNGYIKISHHWESEEERETRARGRGIMWGQLIARKGDTGYNTLG